MPVNHDRPQSGYFDAHPPREAYSEPAEPLPDATPESPETAAPEKS